MTNQPKTIITYLVDGNPTGIKTVEFSTRLIKGVSVPRNDFKNALERNELKFSGVYFLLGEDEQWNNVVYIWQATVLWKRLNDHFKDTSKDFWNNAICFTSKDWSLNESDINFLEKEVISLAKKANRYRILNSTSWNNWLILENRIPDMMEFMDDMWILMLNLGYFVLKELVNKKSSSKHIYYLNGSWGNATWVYSNEWFIVLKWSIWPNRIAKSHEWWYAEKHRPRLIQEWVIFEKDNNIIFASDYVFSSPSGAAILILGRSANWRIERKDKNWKTLDENERKSLDS